MDRPLTSAAILSDPATRASVYAHAMAWFPKEGCGLLLDGPDGVEVVLSDNLADRLHAEDPETYPRTGELYYVLDPKHLMDAERRGRRIVGIFHSHCGFGAYFSDTDVRDAMAPWGDPLYPDTEFIVLNAHADGVRGFAIFEFDEALGTYTRTRYEGLLGGTNVDDDGNPIG